MSYVPANSEVGVFQQCHFGFSTRAQSTDTPLGQSIHSLLVKGSLQ